MAIPQGKFHHVRTFDTDLLVRDDPTNADGKTLEGLVVPYDVETDIPAEGIREVFRQGAFRHQVKAAHRLGLYDGHHTDTDHRLGVCRDLVEKPEGLWARFRLLSSRAQVVADLVAEGHQGLSLGFVDWRRKVQPSGLVERTSVHLDHVALIAQGAYQGAMVLSVRDQEAAPLIEVAPGFVVGPDHDDYLFWMEVQTAELARNRVTA